MKEWTKKDKIRKMTKKKGRTIKEKVDKKKSRYRKRWMNENESKEKQIKTNK